MGQMKLNANKMTLKYKTTSWHIGVAAEAFAAALFARFGYDVSVQYGANQPEYDLMIADGDSILKVSVKGSQDGSWGLTQSYLEKGKANYHESISIWLDKHSKKTIFCLLQFKGTELLEIPRVYLATPKEIAKQLRETANGRGDTILYENKIWTKRAFGYGTTDKIPDNWKISDMRIKELFRLTGTKK
jgi:Holliday junction resolvase-like predicted endonuclease